MEQDILGLTFKIAFRKKKCNVKSEMTQYNMHACVMSYVISEDGKHNTTRYSMLLFATNQGTTC